MYRGQVRMEGDAFGDGVAPGVTKRSRDTRNARGEPRIPRDLPLHELRIIGVPATDLTPLLRAVPVPALSCDGEADRDAAALRSLRSLEGINGLPIELFWKSVDEEP
ncbi:MAG: hypothetical protein K2R98_13985 [Gemmataceae bacterium]|nr:hypothetical protein [Gemmataceae bacterium]